MDLNRMTYDQHLLKLLETIQGMAHTVHQAHHLDFPGSFRECPKSVCRQAQEALMKELPVENGRSKRAADWYFQED